MKLTVRDDEGAEASKTITITVASPSVIIPSTSTTSTSPTVTSTSPSTIQTSLTTTSTRKSEETSIPGGVLPVESLRKNFLYMILALIVLSIVIASALLLRGGRKRGETKVKPSSKTKLEIERDRIKGILEELKNSFERGEIDRNTYESLKEKYERMLRELEGEFGEPG